MVVRVAILDDAEQDRKLLENIVKNYFSGKKWEGEVTVFRDYEDLLFALEDKAYYDIFLLDMEMPGKNGLQIAKEIRKFYLDPIIIYVTDHTEYAPAAFEVNAYRYIPKIMLDWKIQEAFDSLIPGIEQLDAAFYIHEECGRHEKIYYRDIYYMKKDGKYVTIFHREGTCRERSTLHTMYEKLKTEGFFYLDKSSVANVRNISSCHRDRILLRDGTELPLSRTHYHEVQKEIMRYWREKL